MAFWLRWVLAVVLLSLLSACARVDSDQARLCRLVLPALHEDGVGITVHHIRPGQAANSVRIAYTRLLETGVHEPHLIQCSFCSSAIG
jgi:hypothetical protein